jgi:hypothetical protein
MLTERTMKTIAVGVTDASGDGAYGVMLNVDAAIWTDNSASGHEISSITQGGNVSSAGGGLACGDTTGGTTLMLNGASWGMTEGSTGSADHQHDPGGPIDHGWTWIVTSVTTS